MFQLESVKGVYVHYEVHMYVRMCVFTCKLNLTQQTTNISISYLQKAEKKKTIFIAIQQVFRQLFVSTV